MEFKNIEILSREVSILGNFLKANKSNPDWIKIVDYKKNTTKADYKIDALLKFILQKYVKDVPYYSEEVPHNIENRPEEYWLADPIDGTSSWAKGFEGYVIQAAYVLKNKPFFSFIYWPEKERFYHCIKGKGFFLNLTKITSSFNQKNPVKVVDNYPEPRGILEKIIKKFSDIEYLEMGSLGLKSLLVATGSCDLFLKTTKFRDWDIIPASLFIEEINYKILNLNANSFNFGSQIEYNEGLLIYNPLKIEKKMINFIKNSEINFDI